MKRSIVIIAAFALLMGIAAPAEAQQPSKRYPTCKAVWKKYPTGLVSSKYFVDQAVKKGYKRPRVNARDYFDSERLAQEYMICPVAPPDVIPSPPSFTSAYASPQGLSITALWNKPADAGMNFVYDVYLDGVKVNEGLTRTAYTWTGLAPSTTYTIGVTTRNPAGTSPMANATATTIGQEAANNPGRVKVTYSASGTVDVTLQATSGTQQFSAVTNPTYEFWFTPGSFVYFSVQNQNDSGDVSCSITSNGRSVSRNTSSGAYVIATCSGRA